jgi:hypothetical protein
VTHAITCALCGKPSNDVSRMLQGTSGAVCLDCTAWAVASFDGETFGTWSLHCVLSSLRNALAAPAAGPMTGTLLDAALVLAGTRAGWLRHVRDDAFRLSFHGQAIRAAEQIAEGERTGADRVTLAWMRLYGGDATGAARELEPLTRDPPDGDLAISHRIVRAAVIDALDDPAQISVGEEAAREARRLLAQRTAPPPAYAPALVWVLARYDLRAGRLDDARLRLEAEGDHLLTRGWFVLGEVRVAMGAADAARKAFTRARDRAPAGSHLQNQAAARLQALGSAT